MMKRRGRPKQEDLCRIGLSERQLAVSRGLLSGLSLKAIAIDLGICNQTASLLKTVVFEKFGLLDGSGK